MSRIERLAQALTVWYGNKIVDNKKIKLKYNDKG